ncbi:hypothetical protein GPAL_3598 [Glaciecola pallidula DSM 14239 = ACAM 615]|uniref:Uncharacterized protein n=1 Tax=Brumicola pallidula DSM 14239 = ACAM 615 TaxID=1121922 RepID=K7A4L6_9ALTE|nr:hypothetical protein GPAL_3598 [Glaciecola pallidula DSM 14239 = ACAM 615]
MEILQFFGLKHQKMPNKDQAASAAEDFTLGGKGLCAIHLLYYLLLITST